MSSILKIGSYRVKSTVRGYHVYGLHWKPVEGTLYRCQRELDNKYYSYAVAVYHDKPGTVVGHIPKEDAKLYSSLLQMQPPVTLHCMVIGKSFRRVNDGITELPCEYVFKSSSEENIQTIRNKLEASEGRLSSLQRVNVVLWKSELAHGELKKCQKLFLLCPSCRA